MKNKPMNILYIEDDREDGRLAQKVCKTLNLSNNLFVVSSAEGALEFLKKEGAYRDVVRPDAILLDLNLPKMSGQDLLKEIKKDHRFSAIPTAILTGSKADENIIRGYDQRTHRYFQKPVEFEEFVKTIKEIEKFCQDLVGPSGGYAKG